MRFLQAMQRAYGDVVQFPVPVPPSYFISDPDHVRHVLVANARNYDKQTMQYRGLSVLTGEGLLTADPPLWRERRAVVQPAFHHEAVAGMRTDVEAAVDSALARWKFLEVIDVEAEMMQLALDIVGRTLFGADVATESDDLSHTTLRALDAVVARAQQPLSLPLSVPTRGNRRLRAAVRALDEAVARLLQQRQPAERAGATMLDLLLDAYGLAPGRPVPQAVRDEVVTFIVAGHETVASGLTWACALLMREPEHLGRLRESSDEDREALARAIFEETLRLYPPAWLITRRATAADRFGDVDVPAGALVIISPWVVHRDPRWWPAADEFDPARFLGADGIRRAAYLPFGAGPRMCIGREMALLEGSVALARICAAVSLESPTGMRAGLPAVNASVTLRPAAPVLARLRWH